MNLPDLPQEQYDPEPFRKIITCSDGGAGMRDIMMFNRLPSSRIFSIQPNGEEIPEGCTDICNDVDRLNEEVTNIEREQNLFKTKGFTWRTFERDRIVKTAHLKKRVFECEECKLGLPRGTVQVPIGYPLEVEKVFTSNTSLDEFIEVELAMSLCPEVQISEAVKFGNAEPRNSHGCLIATVFIGGFFALGLIAASC